MGPTTKEPGNRGKEYGALWATLHESKEEAGNDETTNNLAWQNRGG
jgi:hypothetical protein